MESRTRGRTRLPWTSGAAIGAHAVALAFVAYVAPRPAAELRRSSPPEQELDLDVTAIVSEDAVPNSSSAAAAPSEVRRDARARSGTAIARESDVAPHAGPAPDSARETALGDGPWTFSPAGAGSVAGGGTLAGRALDAAVRAGVAATLAQNRAENHTGWTVIPPFTSREIELGLAPGGVLATLGRDIVRRSRVPDVSRAKIQFDTDATGVVVACRVLDATSGWPEWEEATREIMTASHAKPPMRVPSGARGLSITLNVSSDLRTVDGDTRRGLFDRAAHLPLLRVTTARLADVDVL